MNNTQIDYLFKTFNIKETNPYIIDDIAREAQGVDFNSFRSYAIENKNKQEFAYSTGFDKLILLINKFKNQNNNTLAIEDKIITYCKKLVNKCRSASCSAYNTKPDGLNFEEFAKTAKFEMFRTENENAFNEKEIRLLESVGGCRKWLLDYDEDSFLQDLIKSLKNLNKIKTVPLVENQDKNIVKKLTEKR